MKQCSLDTPERLCRPLCLFGGDASLSHKLPKLQSDGTTSAPSQGAMSVDSITDLSDNTSRLLEALQLSHPHELGPWRSLGKKKMLSLNPITWQVPRIVDRCCKHIEMHGKYSGPTVGW